MNDRIRRAARTILCIVVLWAPAGAHAQVLTGRVLDATDSTRPVAAALVKLISSDGTQHAAALSDSVGNYRLEVPSPGEYRIEAEAFGWQPYASTLFEMTGLAGVFPVDLLMAAAPIQLEGMRVDADRLGRLGRQIQLVAGRNPISLRTPPIGQIQIRRHWEQAHDLVDMIKFENTPGLVVRDGPGGVCFSLRERCLPLYLNGMRADENAFAHAIPLEMLEVVVVVQPSETIAHPGGAVLLFTTHFVR